MRPVEQFFARELRWTSKAQRRLRTYVFYGHNGAKPKAAAHLTPILRRVTGKYLGVRLGVQDWRHFAAALAQVAEIFQFDPLDESDETMNIGDAQAGHTKHVANTSYAIPVKEFGYLNPRIWATFHAYSRLFQTKLLGLQVPGKVATAADIESSHTSLNDDGSLELRMTHVEAATKEIAAATKEIRVSLADGISDMKKIIASRR